jgi:hypothetical protein
MREVQAAFTGTVVVPPGVGHTGNGLPRMPATL